jgi:hypothetical protein
MNPGTCTSPIAQRIAVAFLLMVAYAFLGGRTVAAAPAEISGSGFCGVKQVRNYLAPFKRMTPLRRVPATGHLPFAPRGISIYTLGSGLRVGKGPIGFAFSDSAGDRPRRLSWVVETELARVDALGRPGPAIVTKVRRFGTKKISEVNGQRFVVSGQAAFYRVTIEIRKQSGKLMGRYGQYYRVVSPRLGVRLAASNEEVAPEETIFARVENMGTETVTPDSQVQIEQLIDGSWRAISTVTALGLKPQVKRRVPGGKVDPCFAYRVPLGQEPGFYRFVGTATSLEGRKAKVLIAKFQVAG